MRYLSLFSGIEAASVAWEPLGWEAVGFAEFEDFPKAVLAQDYPNVLDLGDVTQKNYPRKQIKALGHIDIIVGGSPMPRLSVALVSVPRAEAMMMGSEHPKRFVR